MIEALRILSDPPEAGPGIFVRLKTSEREEDKFDTQFTYYCGFLR